MSDMPPPPVDPPNVPPAPPAAVPPPPAAVPPAPPAAVPPPPAVTVPAAVPSAAAGPTLPPGVTIVSPGMRLVAYLLEGVLVVVTLFIGWLIWAAIIAGNGQTPAKKILGQRVVKGDGSAPVGFATMLFMRGLIAGFIASIAITLTLGILLLMPFWDKRNQNIWDKVSGTLVVNDPANAWQVS
jgi:uncharacterized RDD family membrane protein YckC